MLGLVLFDDSAVSTTIQTDNQAYLLLVQLQYLLTDLWDLIHWSLIEVVKVVQAVGDAYW